MSNTDPSPYVPPPDHIQFDATTGETTNRGIPMDEPSRTHAVRAQREDDIEEECFRANVRLHGYDKAKAMLDNVRAMDGRWK